MTLFKFICVQYQFHRQTLPIMKIDRGQIQFRDYVSTGTEPFACKVDHIMRCLQSFSSSQHDIYEKNQCMSNTNAQPSIYMYRMLTVFVHVEVL